MELENVVYYQGETHYFVMTPKKGSLLEYGVLKQKLPPPSDLARENVDQEKLKKFARGVADMVGLPSYVNFITDGACWEANKRKRKRGRIGQEEKRDIIQKKRKIKELSNWRNG